MRCLHRRSYGFIGLRVPITDESSRARHDREGGTAGLLLQRDPTQGLVRLARIIGNSNESAAEESGQLGHHIAPRLDIFGRLLVAVEEAPYALPGGSRKPTATSV